MIGTASEQGSPSPVPPPLTLSSDDTFAGSCGFRRRLLVFAGGPQRRQSGSEVGRLGPSGQQLALIADRHRVKQLGSRRLDEAQSQRRNTRRPVDLALSHRLQTTNKKLS